MIGVVASDSEGPVVREFFELFKTPWEFYRSGRAYDVLVCAGEPPAGCDRAKLVIVYGAAGPDSEAISGRRLMYNGVPLHIYGKCATYPAGEPRLLDAELGSPVIAVCGGPEARVVRIGYELFSEVRTLLTEGQPAINAGIPALEMHIAVLREEILENGIPLLEIPPIPDGWQFAACLTHDVDHALLRSHKLDHTVLGFLYRATVGSLHRLLRGRLPWRGFFSNWLAVLKFPLVHLGLAKDFWCEFDRYTVLEKGLRSSFFVIPFKDRPGDGEQGPAPRFRASGYSASDISSKIRELVSAGCEIGVHGIDAWRDSTHARAEVEEIRRITGQEEIGARMHWLYFNEQSPAILEAAGIDYDSTGGYNETIGYLAGTTQAYKPLETRRLLELPLHVMDTALFFSGHLNLSPQQARERVGRLIDQMVQFGGCLTLNWHDRSIAPERQWGDFYRDLIDELQDRGAWFSTAAQAVAWFRKRRSATFEEVLWEAGSVRVKIAVDPSHDLPDLQLRVHYGPQSYRDSAAGAIAVQRGGDAQVRHTVDTCVALAFAE